MEEVKSNKNPIFQFLSIKDKLRLGYGNKFDTYFKVCIDSIKQSVKEIEVSFLELEILSKNVISDVQNDWRIKWGNDGVLSNVSNKSSVKVKLSTKDVFNDHIQIKIQNLLSPNSDIWITKATATVTTLDLFSEKLNVIEFHSLKNDGEIVCRLNIQTYFPFETYFCCNSASHCTEQDSPIHELVVNLSNILYSDDEDKGVAPEMLILMAQVHNNNENDILNCLRSNPTFNHEVCNTYDLFMDLKAALPRSKLKSGTWKWFLASTFPNLLSVLTLFLVMFNEGFDISLAYEYYHWNYILDTYELDAININLKNASLVETSNEANCSIFCNFSDCIQSEIEYCENPQDRCYPERCFIRCNSRRSQTPLNIHHGLYVIDSIEKLDCYLNVSSTLNLQVDQSMSISKVFSCRKSLQPLCNTITCKIHGLDPSLAFVFAFSILVFIRACHLIRILFALCVYGPTDRMGISSFISFYLGCCCLKNFQNKDTKPTRWMQERIRLAIVILVAGILMPFATKLFLIIVDAQTFQLEDDLVGQQKRRKLKGRCKRCSSCNDENCLCIFCGNSTMELVKDYKDQLTLCKMRARRSNTTTRCTVVGFQDTFMCILQAYLTLPLIKQYYKLYYEDKFSLATEKTYNILVFNLFSITTSVLSLSRNLTMSFFELSSKGYLVKSMRARCVYYVDVAIMIIARLLTIALLGLSYFHEKHHIQKAPNYLASLVVYHMALVFIVGILQHCSIRKVTRNNTDNQKQFNKRMFSWKISLTQDSNPEYNKDHPSNCRAIQIVMFNLYSSIMSVFTLTRTRSFRTLGGKERLLKMSGEVNDKMNYYDRLYFNIIVFSEQFAMFYIIYVSSDNDSFIRHFLYHVIILFFLGQLLSVYFSLTFDPWSLYIPWLKKHKRNFLHKHKQKLISAIWVSISIIIVGYMFYLIPHSQWLLGSMICTICPLMFLGLLNL